MGLPARGEADQGGVGVEVGAQLDTVRARVVELDIRQDVREPVLRKQHQALVDLHRHAGGPLAADQAGLRSAPG